MAGHDVTVTGGCQCGAMRYRFVTAGDEPVICHCRMCQKATGGPFLASTGGPRAGLAWMRGVPKAFRSSSIAERGFCAACGTPLTYERLGSGRIWVSLGSLDDPAALPALEQGGVEDKLAWVDVIAAMPGQTTQAWFDEAGIKDVVNYQHTDRETSA